MPTSARIAAVLNPRSPRTVKPREDFWPVLGSDFLLVLACPPFEDVAEGVAPLAECLLPL